MTRQGTKFKIALKYCGSCNPYIDLKRIAGHLISVIEDQEDCQRVSPEEQDIKVAVILCGCHRACGNKEGVRTRTEYYLMIAGESFMDQYVSEENLPMVAGARLLETLGKLRDKALR